jgi:hypothetical protein
MALRYPAGLPDGRVFALFHIMPGQWRHLPAHQHNPIKWRNITIKIQKYILSGDKILKNYKIV